MKVPRRHAAAHRLAALPTASLLPAASPAAAAAPLPLPTYRRLTAARSRLPPRPRPRLVRAASLLPGLVNLQTSVNSENAEIAVCYGVAFWAEFVERHINELIPPPYMPPTTPAGGQAALAKKTKKKRNAPIDDEEVAEALREKIEAPPGRRAVRFREAMFPTMYTRPRRECGALSCGTALTQRSNLPMWETTHATTFTECKYFESHSFLVCFWMELHSIQKHNFKAHFLSCFVFLNSPFVKF